MTQESTHKSGVSYRENEVKERLQTSLQSRRVLLNLRMKENYLNNKNINNNLKHRTENLTFGLTDKQHSDIIAPVCQPTILQCPKFGTSH